MAELGDGADLAVEAVEDPGAFQDVPIHHLEHLVAAHEAVVGEVDDAHAAPAQFAADLVIGVLGQVRRERVGRGPGWRTLSLAALRDTVARSAGGPLARRPLGLPQPFQEAVRRQLRHPAAAVGALFEVLMHRPGRPSSSLPRPYESRVCSVGCGDGGASIGESPGPNDDRTGCHYSRKAGAGPDLPGKCKIIPEGPRPHHVTV